VKPLGLAGVVCLVLGVAAVLSGLLLAASLHGPAPARAAQSSRIAPPPASPAPSAIPTSTPPPTPAPAATPTARSFDALQTEVDWLLQSAGADGAVTLVELRSGESWSFNGDTSFVAASTYKLPLLMEEAQAVASGSAHETDLLCYDPSDWEDGWFSDYAPGDCYTRGELDQRVGEYSDNTAAHILVRADGGGDALNAYARAHGATESEFYDPNVTTSSDLARLWQDEAAGRAGGAAAQLYLYPLLTNTAYEDGIPAGVPAGTTVVHKIGILDSELNDAALVTSGPRGPYVLSVCTDGAPDWSVIADVARAVSQFEAG
jgi:beta-lactamase class A